MHRFSDAALAVAFSSSESTLAEISFELFRNSISISIKWFYSESNAERRVAGVDVATLLLAQPAAAHTNTFEWDAPIQSHIAALACIGEPKSSSSEESESANELRFHLCSCLWQRQRLRRHLQLVAYKLMRSRQRQRSLQVRGVCTGWTLCWTRLNHRNIEIQPKWIPLRKRLNQYLNIYYYIMCI